MGPRKYPPLTTREIEQILKARGFSFVKSKGDHNYYFREVRGKKHIAQIDTGCPLYNNTWIKLLINESGMTREQFYCSTKSTAKKIGMPCAKSEDLENWAIA